MSHRLVLILLLVNGVIYAQQQLESNKLKMPGPNVQNLMLGTWSIKVQYPPTPDMLNVTKRGFPKPVLENRDINRMCAKES